MCVFVGGGGGGRRERVIFLIKERNRTRTHFDRSMLFREVKKKTQKLFPCVNG